MPTLTIKIKNKDFNRIKEYAEKDGFKNPADWARFLVEKNIELAESPKLKPSEVISKMAKTGLYKTYFLRELKKSLAYADKIA